MVIIEDSRQQIIPEDKHIIKHEWWKSNGDILHRNMLPCGDYALPPSVAVDTKNSMAEIAGNIGGSKDEHERFIRELKLARDMGTKLYVLVENSENIKVIDDVWNWKNPRRFYSPKAIDGQRLFKAMKTIESKYGCTFLFCTPESAAEIINKLLRGSYEKDA